MNDQAAFAFHSCAMLTPGIAHVRKHDQMYYPGWGSGCDEDFLGWRSSNKRKTKTIALLGTEHTLLQSIQYSHCILIANCLAIHREARKDVEFNRE